MSTDAQTTSSDSDVSGVWPGHQDWNCFSSPGDSNMQLTLRTTALKIDNKEIPRAVFLKL